MNRWIGLGAACLLLSACTNTRLKHLQQKWKTVALQNGKMEAEIAAFRASIDTLGNQDPALAAAFDLDSLRAARRAELQASIEEQQIALQNTLMEFSPNGVVYTTSPDGIDSAYYTLEGDDIRIDEARLKGHGESMTFHILHLTEDTLNVRLVDYGDTSVAVMVLAR